MPRRGSLDVTSLVAHHGGDSGQNTFSGRGVVSNPESIVGASFVLKMNETSGSIVDAVGGVTLIVNSAANTYSVAGSGGYDPGITMNAVAGGFRTNADASVAGLSFGTGDANHLLRMRVDGTPGGFPELFISTVREAGTAGFSIRVVKGADASTSNLSFSYIATDTTTVTGTWPGNELGTAIFNGTIFTVEFRTNRTSGLLECFCNGVSQGTVSIATLAGKSLDHAVNRLGVAQDSRAAIDRNVPVTIWFIRVKKSVT